MPALGAESRNLLHTVETGMSPEGRPEAGAHCGFCVSTPRRARLYADIGKRRARGAWLILRMISHWHITAASDGRRIQRPNHSWEFAPPRSVDAGASSDLLHPLGFRDSRSDTANAISPIGKGSFRKRNRRNAVSGRPYYCREIQRAPPLAPCRGSLVHPPTHTPTRPQAGPRHRLPLSIRRS